MYFGGRKVYIYKIVFSSDGGLDMDGFMEIWWWLGLVGDVLSGDIFYCY